METARRKAEASVNRVSAPKTALVSGIGLVLKCDEAALVRQIVTTHDRDLIRKRLDEVVDKILAIQVALEQLKDMEVA
jgi:beta-glucosidase-like glycosyl hydrolase